MPSVFEGAEVFLHSDSLYFVHGLGGHAFDTWASPISKKSSHASLKMWPRDLLPQRFEESGLRGRFSTLGYNANVFRNTSNTTIESAAIELLYHLRNDRPEVSSSHCPMLGP